MSWGDVAAFGCFALAQLYLLMCIRACFQRDARHRELAELQRRASDERERIARAQAEDEADAAVVELE